MAQLEIEQLALDLAEDFESTTLRGESLVIHTCNHPDSLTQSDFVELKRLLSILVPEGVLIYDSDCTAFEVTL